MCLGIIRRAKKTTNNAITVVEANKTSKIAAKQLEQNAARLKEQINITEQKMEELGFTELLILKDFGTFSDTIERIQKMPSFSSFSRKLRVKLPEFDHEALRKISLDAGSLLERYKDTAIGIASGFAAAGALDSNYGIYAALNSTSNTKAISTVLEKNTITLKDKAIASGKVVMGGTMAAANFVSIIFKDLPVVNILGKVASRASDATTSSMSKKADKDLRESKDAEVAVNEACNYLDSLDRVASLYISSLKQVKAKYDQYCVIVSSIVNGQGKNNWKYLSKAERVAAQNAVLLAELLNKMCQVQLVDFTKENEMNRINDTAVQSVIREAEIVLREVSA